MKRSRIGISEDSQFTADEIEVADILIHFQTSLSIEREEFSRNTKVLPRRDKSENNYELQHGGMNMAPPPERRLPTISRPNSKDVRATDRPGRKVPKKKTHRELTETVDKLSLEKARLIKEVQQRRKTNQGLKDDNGYLKSQLALCLEQ